MSSSSDSTSDNFGGDAPLQTRRLRNKSALRSSSPSSIKQATAILRLESLVLLVITVLAYHYVNGSWLVFILSLLLFDISMIGYVFSDKLGAITYNLGHTMVLPGLLLLVGCTLDTRWLVLAALIWLAHINMDRAIGYGLKHETFQQTHLGVIGKHRKS